MVIGPLATTQTSQHTHSTNLSKGLTSQEIVVKRQQYGINEFSKPKEPGLLHELIEVFKQPLMVILFIAAGMSFLVGEYQDGIGICMAVTLAVGIGRVTEGKSKKAAESLAKMTEDVLVKVVRDGKKQHVRKNEIVPGDVVYLESGDMVPADGYIVEATELKLREDMLTGESDQVKKQKNSPVYSGTLVGNGNGIMIVTTIGDETQMGIIAKELGVVEHMTPLQQKLSKLAQNISSISSVVAGLLFIFMLYQIFSHGEIDIDMSSWDAFVNSIRHMNDVFPHIKTAFVVCVGLLVAAVPEGLPTMVNITLALTMSRMAKINVLIRKKEACETIGSVSVICSDKTGTLTENKMKVAKLYVEGEFTDLTNINQYPILKANCMLNSTADIQLENNLPTYIGNPTEGALLLLAGADEYQTVRRTSSIVKQIPFASQNKYMLTITRDRAKYVVLSKGAPEVILKQCAYENINGRLEVLNQARINEILEEIKLLQVDAMRVIAFAYKETTSSFDVLKTTNWEKQLVFQGFVGITDPLREGVKESIEMARHARIETKILTGDNIHTASAIGKELGIITPDKKVVEASYIETLTDAELRKEIKSIAIVARSMPNTKMRIVQALQKNGEVVAVTGDGINDAPALSKADVGIAMGIAGTEVSRNAADIILTDDSFNTIVEAIKWGRGIYNNIQRYLQFSLTVNVIAFVTTIISQILHLPLPFTTIHLLWVNIIMDGPPALALGMEPIRESVMRRKPTSRKAHVINPFMINTIVMNSFYIIIVLYCQLKFNFLGADLTREFAHASEFQTVAFTLFASLTMFNALNCREFGIASILPNFLKNKFALMTLGITLGLQFFMTQYFGGFFHTVPLSMIMWIKIIAVGSSVVIVSESVKTMIRIVNLNRKKVLKEGRRVAKQQR